MIGRDMERSLRPNRNSSNTRADQNASIQPSTNQNPAQPVYSSRLRLRTSRSTRQQTPGTSASATPGTRRFRSDEEDRDEEKEDLHQGHGYQTRRCHKEESHQRGASASHEPEDNPTCSPEPHSNEDLQNCAPTDVEGTEPKRITRLRPSRGVRSYIDEEGRSNGVALTDADAEPEGDSTSGIRRSSRITVMSKQKKPYYGEMADDNMEEGESSSSNRTYNRRDFNDVQQTEICEVKTYVPTSRPGLRARAEINYGDCGGYVIRPPPIRRQRSSLEDAEDDETSIPKSYDLRPRMPKSYKENLLLESPSKAGRRQDRRNRSRSASPRYHNHSSRRDRYGRDDRDPFNSDDDNAENGIAKSRRSRPANVRSQILPINLSQKELAERPLYTSSPSDRFGTESSVAGSGFDLVGGLDHIVLQVKESIVLPLLYPELCRRCTPARGILFSGPPGTGKTLLGKAVAQACSKDDRKVAFFHVRGPEIMSKWYGESERNLRGIFEAAKRFQPSVIFFDEIDGLAPSRNSQSDQHYTSVVTTLLTLMDGIEDRGQVVVIGATNRKEAVDSALRRPGRFDKEFIFTLPDEVARNAILKIHTSTWEENSPSDELRKELAYMTEGFSGADIKSLCNEASMCAIRRRYPQIFQSDVKLLVDPAQVIPKKNDFLKAFESITPTSLRSEEEQACPLPPRLEPLLREPMEKALRTLDVILPGSRNQKKYNENAQNTKVIDPRIFRPRMLISGHAGMGQQHMAHAILHYLSGYYIQSFDLASLQRESASMESVCIELFLELKCRAPAVIYLPRLDKWWESASVLLRNTFHGLLETLDPNAQILLLATMDAPESSLVPEVRSWFGGHKTGRIALEAPSKIACQEFFQEIVDELRVPPSEENSENADSSEVDELPIAPTPKPRQLTKEELLARRSAEAKVFSELSRELKGFLEVIAPMRSYRTFYTSRPPPYLPSGTFSDGAERQRIRTLLETAPSGNDELPSPGNLNGAPTNDHPPTLTLQLVTNKVIDLETIYRRIYAGRYCSVEEFTKDVEEVCSIPEAFGDSLLPDDNKCWTIYTKAEDIRAKLATLREHIPDDLLEESKRMLAQLELDTSMGFWPLTDSACPMPGKGKRQPRTPATTSRNTLERKTEHNRDETGTQLVDDVEQAECIEEGEVDCVDNQQVEGDKIVERVVEGISSAPEFVQSAVEVGNGKPLDLLVEMKAHLLSVVDLHRHNWDKSEALQECIGTLTDWV